jgi:hypothetical protein
VSTLYENKAHQRTCAFRFIPPESLRAQRDARRNGEAVGEPPHCTCLKPIRSFERLKKLLAERAAKEEQR